MKAKVFLSGSMPLELMLHDQEAVLCNSCENALDNISKLESRLTALKEEMKEKISSSVKHYMKSGVAGKRSASQATFENQLPSAKTVCISSTASEQMPSQPCQPRITSSPSREQRESVLESIMST